MRHLKLQQYPQITWDGSPFQSKKWRTNCFEEESIVVEIILDEQYPIATLRPSPLDHDI